MRKINLYNRLAILMVAVTVMSAGLLAQQGPNKAKSVNAKAQCMIPDLSDEQSTQIQQLKMDKMKKTADLKLDLQEKKIQLTRLERADVADMKAIDKKIDEISAIRSQMAKIQAKHKQEVRKILTPEQRLYFDLRRGKGKNKQYAKCPAQGQKGQGQRGGNGYGEGQGKGRGQNF